jgi:hypothetical protein
MYHVGSDHPSVSLDQTPNGNAMRVAVTAVVACLLASAMFAQGGWRDEQAYGTWSDRARFNSTVFNDRIWVFEGFVPWRSSGEGSVWTSGDGLNWHEEVSSQARTSPPWARGWGYSALTVFNGQMWQTGGRGLVSEGVPDIWSTADGTNWVNTTQNAPWTGRYRHTSLAYDGRMWVMGGHQSTTGYMAMNDVWSSTDGVNWTQAATVYPDIWSQRFDHAAVVYNGRMWVMGGRGQISWSGGGLNDVWSSADGVHWVQETANAPWDPRWHFTVTEYAGRLWLIGGGNADFTYGDVWSTTDGRDWRFEGQPWYWRSGHQTVAKDGRLWVIGGGMVPIEYQSSSMVQQGGVWSYGVHVHERTLPVARPDEPYSELIEARGGNEPLTWTLIDGDLPPGLQLAHTQSREMPVRGTPDTIGVYTFTLRIQEAHGDIVEEQITLEVAELPPEPMSSNGTGGCNPAPGGTIPVVLLAAALAAHRRQKRVLQPRQP